MAQTRSCDCGLGGHDYAYDRCITGAKEERTGMDMAPKKPHVVKTDAIRERGNMISRGPVGKWEQENVNRKTEEGK